MLVLWPSGAGDWDGYREQCEFRIAPVSARLFPCSFSAIFLAVFAICAAANGARLPAQTQIPPHLSPFASTMTQQLLQGFSASPCLPSLPPSPPPPPSYLAATPHSSDKADFFFFPQPDSETQQNIEASKRDSEFILLENVTWKQGEGDGIARRGVQGYRAVRALGPRLSLFIIQTVDARDGVKLFQCLSGVL